MLKPIKRRVLIKKLGILDFKGPFSGGKHEYMVKGEHRMFIPNPHKEEIGVVLLGRMIKELGITSDEFNRLK